MITGPGFRAWCRPRRRAGRAAADLVEAEKFVRMFHAEHPDAGDSAWRLAAVRAEIAATGTYVHTHSELQYAVRVAWRHAARCTGRYPWRTLRLRDRRTVHTPEGVAAEAVAHLREATNGGKVRAYVTVCAPDAPRILSPQVVRYAGYPQPDGSITGDPASVELTGLAESLGWKGDGGRFDLLPLIVRDAAGHLHAFPLPRDAVLEVPITHPGYPWFGELGLRWYAVPLISDMYLDAGGIRYPCVPFNGWYQASTEVGVRDLGDTQRYNMLPAVAEGMGLDTSSRSTFWPDRAAVELAAAVHHSYKAAGVMATDHQTEAGRFMRFIAAEHAAGRSPCADWAWIVPPISGSTVPAWHRTYPDRQLKPGYFRHTDT